jgi:hypothetical protein
MSITAQVILAGIHGKQGLFKGPPKAFANTAHELRVISVAQPDDCHQHVPLPTSTYSKLIIK